MNITVLVDFENDSVRTALERRRSTRSEALGRPARHLGAARRSLPVRRDGRIPGRTGVNPRLVEKVRGALDGAGFSGVRIVASGGFTAERIREFEEEGVPVDAYGVGSSLIRGRNDFTADVVLVEGRPVREGGAQLQAETRLERVD